MINYKDIVDKYKPNKPEILLNLIIDLHNNSCQLTPEIKLYIINRFKNNDLPKKEQDEHIFYLIKIIEYYTYLINIPKLTPTKEQEINAKNKDEEALQTNPNEIINLKPEDFKKKEYDYEFLKKLEWENPDE